VKPPSKVRPLSDLRVTRKTNIELAHGDGHGWAVSYADLLMVLLSFFVLYFSFAEENPNTVNEELHKIALSMKGMDAKQIQEITRKPDSLGALEEALKIEGVRLTDKGDHLLLDLESSAFASGAYRLPPALKGQVDAVMSKLQPFQDKLNVTIIGHADKRRLIPRGEFMQDNFDLSSTRALRVLKYMVAKGFPENRASARAASSYDRDARSITFEVRIAKPAAEGSK
jgi:chemotaxis protein MotB